MESLQPEMSNIERLSIDEAIDELGAEIDFESQDGSSV